MRVPYVRGSDTSEEAARKIEPSLPSMKERVLSFVRGRGFYGATVDEVEVELDMRHQTAGARVRDLVLAGYLYDSEERRKTRSGRNGAVWKDVKYQPKKDAPETLDLFPEEA